MKSDCLVDYVDASVDELVSQLEDCEFCELKYVCRLKVEIESELEDRDFWLET